MQMSDKQFAELLNTITHAQKDHDDMIELRTMFRSFMVKVDENILRSAVDRDRIEKKSEAAHNRIDRVIVIGGLTLAGVLLTVAGFLFTHWRA